MVDVEFLRLQNGRVSLIGKLYCTNARGQVVVVTSFITASPAGVASVKAMGLPAWVRAHLTSFGFDRAKVDAGALKPAYEKLNWNAASAIAATSSGNDAIERKAYDEAAKAFRDALKRWDGVPAAHNGLAWALLHADKPDVPAALAAAETAVKLTEEKDASALDTLALAQHRSGKKAEAIATIRKAIALQPRNAELAERLKAIEGEKQGPQ